MVRSQSPQSTSLVPVDKTAGVREGLDLANRVGKLTKGLNRDQMLALWQGLYLDTFNRAQDPSISLNDRKAAAVALGIATEKILLLNGQPTQIVAGIHEHRHNIAEIAEKLSRVARVIDITPISSEKL